MTTNVLPERRAALPEAAPPPGRGAGQGVPATGRITTPAFSAPETAGAFVVHAAGSPPPAASSLTTVTAS